MPVPLYPFKKEFRTNVAVLMKSCGFSNCTVSSIMNFISVQITFPVRPRVAVHPGPTAVPRPLHVDDEFSRMGDGAPPGDRKPSIGGFAATDFARLLVDVPPDTHGEDSSASATTSGTTKRRRASRTVVKDEIDDEGPRLRFVTRASSAATLRSSSGNLRRSSRKRVKTEE
jgi:hypothetical protein